MYTSGSTGQPKGVVVSHANVVRLLDACGSLFAFTPADVWSCFHSFAFDFSVWELWCALMTGACTVIASRDEIRAPRDFADLVLREGVTILSQTPSAFRQLQEHLLTRAPLGRLRYVVFGGEALDPTSLRAWFAAVGEPPALINMYGITETTVHVTFRQVRPSDTDRVASVIGHPLPDMGILLLTPEGTLAPRGAPAEMFVAGGGVSKGYLERPDLTAERFVETPLLPGHRLYRTGDLARMLPGGSLEFLGRADQQVKVRGHRIEPGEVEFALRQHDQIRDARVVPRTPAGADSPELAAYLLVDGPTPPVTALRAHLERTLPRYMVPTWFVTVDRIPLTANGKIDIGALPEPEARRPDLGVAFVKPDGELEEAVAAVWREVLGLETVGSRDSFFDLGGNSLLLVRVAGLLQQRLRRDVTVLQLFEHPTVQALAAHLTQVQAPDLGAHDHIAARAARKRSTLSNLRKR
jgi:acyl-coenzyme A synthetase/AMP-(fatty) acid ligase